MSKYIPPSCITPHGHQRALNLLLLRRIWCFFPYNSCNSSTATFYAILPRAELPSTDRKGMRNRVSYTTENFNTLIPSFRYLPFHMSLLIPTPTPASVTAHLSSRVPVSAFSRPRVPLSLVLHLFVYAPPYRGSPGTTSADQPWEYPLSLVN